MATKNQADASLPGEIGSALAQLRRQIRRYVFWEGVALVAALAGLLFWGSFLLDTAYFAISRLELPLWFRSLFLVGTLTALAVALVAFVLLRTFQSMRSRALALVLERRFPQLGDALITAVEASEQQPANASPYEQAMLARTFFEAKQALQRLELHRVFNPRPLRRAIIAAVVLCVSVLGLAVVDSSAMERWIDGYWRLQPSYWPRETELTVRVRTQPGDKIREIAEGHFRHPRGGDLELLVETVSGKVKPNRVRLDYRLAGGSWKRMYLTATGDQPFQSNFPSLLDTMELVVSGGDYVSPEVLQIDVVEPPQIDRVEMSVLYPAYTGLNARDASGKLERTPLPALGAQVSLPMGTDARFSGHSNKPLSQVRVELDAGEDRFEWLIRREKAPGDEPAMTTSTLTMRARDQVLQAERTFPPDGAERLLSDDGTVFTLPFVVQADGGAALQQWILTSDHTASDSAAGTPPWPAETALRIYLEDADGIPSPEPLKMSVSGIVDQPPEIDVRLRGIGSSITRQARIPLEGTIRDDYGIAKARFEFTVNDETEAKQRDFAVAPMAMVPEFALARAENEPFERFDVLPLDLSLKQKLSIVVYAADGDTLKGPNEQRSQKFTFNIVSVEDLMSLLYDKELNLRRRFEQVLSELKQIQQDLETHRQQAQEWNSATADRRRALELGLSACAERSLHSTRKNTAEMISIAAAFGEIRDEMVNNAADTPQNMERIEGRIMGPLEQVNTAGLPAVDSALGLFSLANRNQSDRVPAITDSQRQLAAVIASLERVLLEMRKLETFHEALELLKAIMEDHDEISKETKTQRKQKALQALD